MSNRKGKSFKLQLLDPRLVHSICIFFNLKNAMRNRKTFKWIVYCLCFLKKYLFSPLVESNFLRKEYLQQSEIHLQAGS